MGIYILSRHRSVENLYGVFKGATLGEGFRRNTLSKPQSAGIIQGNSVMHMIENTPRRHFYALRMDVICFGKRSGHSEMIKAIAVIRKKNVHHSFFIEYCRYILKKFD